MPPAPFKKIQVVTNSFLITQIPTKEYYMYDVVFHPDVPQMPKRNKLFHHMQTTVAASIFHPRLVYDGRAIAYSPGKMNLDGNNGASFTVMLGRPDQPPAGTRGAYQIRINITTSPPIDPQHVKDILQGRKMTQRSTTAINVMQLIVRQGPNQHHTNNGRAYFTGRDAMPVNRSGIELWRGLFQSVRPTFDGMVLTIDTSTAVVYKSGKLIDLAMDFLGVNNVRQLELMETDANYKKLEKFLKKLRIKVVTGVNGSKSRIKTIRGLVPYGGEYQFLKEDVGETMTVAEYFDQAYGIRIAHRRIVGISLSGAKGSGTQDVVPMELCNVEPGQLYKHKVPESVTPQMVKFSTMKPFDRLAKIVAGAKEYDRSEFVYESGMKVNTNPMLINAKILPPPRVEYGGRNTMEVSNGAWNVLGKTFYDAAELPSWAMVNFTPHSIDIRACQKMVHGLMTACSSLGMRVNQPHDIYPYQGRDPAAFLEQVMDKIRVKLGAEGERFLARTVLLIILPQNGAIIRTEVKRWGDSARGIITQCMREGKVERANNQYHNNVALKINARLGGKNSKSISPAMLELQKEPFIVMGADVSHPGPGILKPSVASLVYSHDHHATQYACLWGIQTPRQENIEDLRSFVCQAVDNWGTKNGTAPKRIFFFRDGLSEGEIERTARKEIEDVEAGIRDLWVKRAVASPPPRVTFIVVGKRHHAVFFPTKDPGQADRTGNCYAGSVFDMQITHPALNDFYLQSHSAIQGTCRSSHYIVLQNQNDDQFTIDRIQDLAYSLCCVYAKATRSVSIPAPVYYADLVCSRGPFHTDPNAAFNFDDGMSTSSGQSNFDLASWKSAVRPTNQRLTKTMYFL